MKNKNQINLSLALVILVIFTNSCKKENVTANIVTDKDGNAYHTLTIGTQTWMVENLRTTKFNDGTNIPLVTDNAEWIALSTPGYCWYNNDTSANKSIYGAMYNWYTVNSGKLCPSGWHVPTDEEWTVLTTYLGGESVAGGKLKEVGTMHWLSPNTGATNETGFTALPGGFRDLTGAFIGMGFQGSWWSFTEYNSSDAWGRYLANDPGSVGRGSGGKQGGVSVRCIKDK